MSAEAIPLETTRPDPRTYFGGGDAAAILELHPYRTAEDVIREKLGMTEPRSASFRMQRGAQLEPLLADWYAAEHADRRDLLTYPGAFVRHPQHAFLGGHPDALLALGNGSWRLVEFKWTTRYGHYGAAGTNEVPDDVYCQVEHYAMILREGIVLDGEAHVVADMGEEEPRLYKIPLVAHNLDYLRDREVEAWEQYVEGRILPPPGNAAQARARWPHETQPVAHATSANIDDHARLVQLQRQAKAVEVEIDMLKLKLMRTMQECGTLMDGRHILARWTAYTSRHLDVSKLKKELPAVYEQYSVEKPTRKFLVKERST